MKKVALLVIVSYFFCWQLAKAEELPHKANGDKYRIFVQNININVSSSFADIMALWVSSALEELNMFDVITYQQKAAAEKDPELSKAIYNCRNTDCGAALANNFKAEYLVHIMAAVDSGIAPSRLNFSISISEPAAQKGIFSLSRTFTSHETVSLNQAIKLMAQMAFTKYLPAAEQEKFNREVQEVENSPTGINIFAQWKRAAVQAEQFKAAGIQTTPEQTKVTNVRDLKPSVRDYLIDVQNGYTEPRVVKTINELKNFQLGDLVSFGHYEQDNNTNNGKEAIIWRVLAVEKDQVILIAIRGLDIRIFDQATNKWAASSLKRWLDTTFKKAAFNKDELLLINELTLLTTDEVKNYFAFAADQNIIPSLYAKAKATKPLTGNCRWWLKSPFNDNKNRVYGVGFNGGASFQEINDKNICVRPALRIKLKN